MYSIQSKDKNQSLLGKTPFVILALLLFWPFGLYLVWKRSQWPLFFQIFTTLMVVGYILAIVISL